MHLEGTEPPSIMAPMIDENYQTEVAGQYLIGEVAGKPLVKNAANLGRGVVEHMLYEGLRPRTNRRAEGSDAKNVSIVDVAIVGSGPGGLSAALTCIQHGLRYVLLEKNQLIASTVAFYPKGKLIMAEPYDCPNLSFLPVFDSSKETLLPLWKELFERVKLRARLGESVEEIHKRSSGDFDIRTNVSMYRAQRVVLATGTRGKPRTLGVPGENLPKVHSLLDDPNDFRGKQVLVVGGGDSALEAALALSDAGATVMLSYRGRQFSRAMPKTRKALESYAAQKKITVVVQSQVTQFDEESVMIMTAGGEHRFRNDATFVLIGSNPPIEWLGTLGVNFQPRPHSYNAPRSDAFVSKFLGRNALVCPETVDGAVQLILGKSNTAVPTRDPLTSSKFPNPIPLSEFAKTNRNRKRHNGRGRRDELPPGERTRILRMLRDEGGRIADEESKLIDLNFEYDPDTKPPEIFIQHTSMLANNAQPAATAKVSPGSFGAHIVRRDQLASTSRGKPSPLPPAAPRPPLHPRKLKRRETPPEAFAVTTRALDPELAKKLQQHTAKAHPPDNKPKTDLRVDTISDVEWDLE